MLKPVYFAFVKTMLQFFLQATHFVKSRAHSPRPTRKIIATMALRRAIFMKADPVQVRIQDHPSPFSEPLFNHADAQTSNTSTRLWFYYIITKIHPPFQNPGSAPAVVSLHAHRLFSGRACSCRKDPCSRSPSFARTFSSRESTGSPNSKYEHRRTSALLRNIRI